MEIITRQIRRNVTKMKRRPEDILFINIHDTGNPRPRTGGEMHFRYFDGANVDSSADVFIDDREIWVINDWYNYYTWAVGDDPDPWNDLNDNRTSINVEMCIGVDLDREQVIENTLRYVSLLQAELPHAKIQRHYDASGKICPRIFSLYDWKLWWEFLTRLEGYHMGMTQQELRDIAREEAQLVVKENNEKYGVSDRTADTWAQSVIPRAVEAGLITTPESHNANDLMSTVVGLTVMMNGLKIHREELDKKIESLRITVAQKVGGNHGA